MGSPALTVIRGGMGGSLALLVLSTLLALPEQSQTDFVSAPLDSNLTVYLANNFMTTLNDFAEAEAHQRYFPLIKAFEIKSRIIPNGVKYDQINNETDTFVAKYRGFRLSNRERDSLLFDFMNTINPSVDVPPQSIASMLPVDMDVNMLNSSLVKSVNSQPTNIAWLYKLAHFLRLEADNAEREEFFSSLLLPRIVAKELGFILGYRWHVTKANYPFSMRLLVNLPVDQVLSISSNDFNKFALATKLKDKFAFTGLDSGSLLAWYTLIEKNLKSVELTEHYDDYRHLLLVAPLIKMIEYMNFLSAADQIDILRSTNLIPIRVQEIWKEIWRAVYLEGNGEHADKESVASLFFQIGHKLDIDQIYHFYRQEFAHLYHKRHELEYLWIGGTLDVPWPLLKYIAMKHWPSTAPLRYWGQKELLNLGKFAVALSFDELRSIPSSAFVINVLTHLFSDVLSNGQLYVLFDKLNEVVTDKFTLPEQLYPCLHSSVLSGEGITRISPINFNRNKALVIASKRFTPAQEAAFMREFQHLMWSVENLKLILLENINLLNSVSVANFKTNFKSFIRGIIYSGVGNFQDVSMNIKKLDKRLLNHWLEESILKDDGSVDVDELLHPADSLDEGSYLANLAITGLTCNMIEKIPPGDIIRVLSAYRLRLDQDPMPSDNRRCFARAIRKYLMLKSGLYGVSFTSEVELLSMLTTADIRSIGAEIFLVWGGVVLSEIPHPEVLLEVLTVIANDAPHIYLHNGVSVDDLHLLSHAMYDLLLAKNEKKVDIGVLAKMRDLLPYLDDPLPVPAADIRLFVETSYTSSPLARTVCLPRKSRSALRNFIIEGFGTSDKWNSFDLISLGDLLLVMRKEDLMEVPVESLRRALPYLTKYSGYGLRIPEVRGHLSGQLFYEACAIWLNNGQNAYSGEGEGFVDAYENLAHWHISGAQVMNSYLHTTNEHSRRRREVTLNLLETPEEVDYRVLHDQVMEILMDQFKGLSKEKRVEAANIITSTQELLGNGTLIAIGLDPQSVQLSQSDVLGIIGEYKESGNLDASQEAKIVTLATDAQVRLIQKLVKLLKLTPESLGISGVTLHRIINIPTFKDTELFMSTAVYSFTATESISVGNDSTTISSTDALSEIVNEDQSLEKNIDDELTFSNIPEDTTKVSIESAEVVTVTNLRPLDKFEVDCDIIRTAGNSAAMLSAKDILKMEESEIRSCIEVIGSLELSQRKRAEFWSAIKDKTNPLGINVYSAGEMVVLGNLLPAVAEWDQEFLDLSESNIDAISVLGKNSDLLINEYLQKNSKSVLSYLEMASLGKMLCGLNATQWKDLVDRDVFAITVQYIAKLDCVVDDEVRVAINNKQLVELPNLEEGLGSGSHLLELGWLLGVVPNDQLENLPPIAISMVEARSVNNIGNLDIFEPVQLERLSPHAASIIRRDQFGDYLDVPQRQALRASGGQDPDLMRVLDAYGIEMQHEDRTREKDVITPRREASRESGSGAVAGSLVILLISFCITKNSM